MSEIPTWAELRERHLRKAGGAEDMSTFEDMAGEAQERPQQPEQPWYIHVNVPNRPTKEDSSGVHQAPRFEPDKFVIPKEVSWTSGRQTPPQWYPVGGAFVSKENSGYRPGSTGYLDAETSMGSLEDDGNMWTGWKVRLDPAHHQVLGDRKAYTDFLNRFSKPGPRGAVSPDWDRIRDAGIYSIEFPKSYFDSYDAEGDYQYEQPSVMNAMFGEPQAFILDPRAVVEQDTWSRSAYPWSIEGERARQKFMNPAKRTQNRT